MKYITKLILENFQSHKYSELVFNEGMNVIIGPSDSGKSAIIRALKWVLYNEPAGDYFIRENENQCSVTIHTNDGFILKRYRTRSKNGYSLTYPNGEELIFEGIGSSVPDEIIDTIGIRKIQLDSDESASINIGEQLEGPFLLSEKTSTRANAIGRLVGVNILDDAIKETVKDIKNINSRKKNLEESLDNINSELESYIYLDELSSIYNELKVRVNLLEDKNRKLEKLLTLKSNLNFIQSNKENTEVILMKLENIHEIEILSGKLSKEINKYYNFEKILEKLNVYEQRIVITEKTLNLLIDLPQVDKAYSSLEYKIKNYNELTIL
ncbi:MAG TPA: AAA family ATPase, partial [Soehngenia sp.]|nr:AAA family ATPase [Soehngenia sp.]